MPDRLRTRSDGFPSRSATRSIKSASNLSKRGGGVRQRSQLFKTRERGQSEARPSPKVPIRPGDFPDMLRPNTRRRRSITGRREGGGPLSHCSAIGQLLSPREAIILETVDENLTAASLATGSGGGAGDRFGGLTDTV